MMHDAHVMTWLERWRDWYDASLEADHWYSLPMVTPEQAAMLLCQFNPRESTADWLATTTNETQPQDHARMLEQLQAAHTVEPKSRTLRQWWDMARGWKHHSWIDRYISFIDRQVSPINGVQVQASRTIGKLVTPEQLTHAQQLRDEHGATKAAKILEVSRSLLNEKTHAKSQKAKAAMWSQLRRGDKLG